MAMNKVKACAGAGVAVGARAAALGWRAAVGLEVHAQLASRSKLFSGAENSFGGGVNCSVAWLDAGIPGALPVLNSRCVRLAARAALALECRLHALSSFDRKHYFYADSPLGYQITQQRAPLASDGHIRFQVFTPGVHKKPYTKISKIKQIQLEQDSGKSLHDAELQKSLVDLNRAGAPLIELVFEPDLEDGEEAAALVKELVLIVQRLGVCSGRMEEGALRVDANVSVNLTGRPLGTRTEIKNIGSVRGVAGAIKYEIGRQMELVNAGGVVTNQTRSWDAVTRTTVLMRDKEVVQDYRFMPEPNLPPLRLNLTTKEDHPDIISIPLLKESLPELPEESRRKLIEQHKLKPEIAMQIVNEPILLRYFEELITVISREPTKVANILLNECLTVLNIHKIDVEHSLLTVSQLGELIDLLNDKRINLEVCRLVLDNIVSRPDLSPSKIIEENDWGLVSDDGAITRVCVEVMENNPKIVTQYKAGKLKVFKAMLGIIVKNTQNKYDMSLVSKRLEELLKM